MKCKKDLSVQIPISQFINETIHTAKPTDFIPFQLRESPFKLSFSPFQLRESSFKLSFSPFQLRESHWFTSRKAMLVNLSIVMMCFFCILEIISVGSLLSTGPLFEKYFNNQHKSVPNLFDEFNAHVKNIRMERKEDDDTRSLIQPILLELPSKIESRLERDHLRDTLKIFNRGKEQLKIKFLIRKPINSALSPELEAEVSHFHDIFFKDGDIWSRDQIVLDSLRRTIPS